MVIEMQRARMLLQRNPLVCVQMLQERIAQRRQARLQLAEVATGKLKVFKEKFPLVAATGKKRQEKWTGKVFFLNLFSVIFHQHEGMLDLFGWISR